MGNMDAGESFQFSLTVSLQKKEDKAEGTMEVDLKQ